MSSLEWKGRILVSAETAASLLGVQAASVWRAHRRGRILGHLLAGRWWYERQSVLAYARDRVDGKYRTRGS